MEISEENFTGATNVVPCEMATSGQNAGTMGEQNPMTDGQIFVGSNFNPSADNKVDKVKSLFAEVVDLLQGEMKQHPPTNLQFEFYTHARGEILNAQMSAVKYLTCKY